MRADARGTLTRGIPALWPLLGGSVVAAATTIVMFSLQPVWIFLILGALLIVVPTFVIADPERYWLGLFLLFLAFDIKKTLVDGLKVQAALGLEGFTQRLVPEIRLSDLAFGVLLLFWVVRLCRRRAHFYIPVSSLLFVAYLIWASLSALGAFHIYLSAVQLFLEFKLFLIFLYVVNNFDLKRWMPVIKVVLLFLIVLEGAVTVARYRFQFQRFLGGQAFGRVTIDTSKTTELIVEAGEGSSFRSAGRKRGFGTVPSPATTSKLIVVLLPLAFLHMFRGPTRRTRVTMLLIGLLGVAGLLATFSRAGLVAFVFEVPLCIWLARRLGYMTSRTFNLAVFSGIFIAAVSGPLLYFYLSTRPANVSIRLTQYEGTARMIAANPILGVGLNNSTEMLKLYTASTSGPTQDPTRSAYKQPIHSHPLAVIAEIGLVGFCFYFLFYVSMARSGFRLLRARDPEVALTAAIFLAGLLALWVHLLGDPLSEDPILTLMLFSCGVLAGLTRSEQLRSRVRPSPSPADLR